MTLKPSKQSPRLENDVFKWYNGDSFSIEWLMGLSQDGEPYEYNPEDELVFSFFKNDLNRSPIHVFSFSNIQDNTVVLDFDEEISKKFPVGKYVYCVKLHKYDGEIITLYAKKHVEVEKCH